MRWFIILMLGLQTACSTSRDWTYPETKKLEARDTFFGETIADPYRWLEDDQSPVTRDWVRQQNALSLPYLRELPRRNEYFKQLTSINQHERYSSVIHRPGLFLYAANSGLENQDRWFMSRAPDEQGEVILDPNAWDPSGGLSIPNVSLSPDQRWLAYSVSKGGSDWQTWKILDLKTRQTLPDEVQWSKFNSVTWAADSSGFYYSRMPEPQTGKVLSGITLANSIYFHTRGEKQSMDQLVFKHEDPKLTHSVTSTGQDGFLVLSSTLQGTDNNTIAIRPLRDRKGPFLPVFNKMDAAYKVLGHDRDTLYVFTNAGAPRSRIIAVKTGTGPDPKANIIIPEPPGRDTLDTAVYLHKKLYTVVSRDVKQGLLRFDTQGRLETEVKLPTMASLAPLENASIDSLPIYVRVGTYFERPRIYSLASSDKELRSVWEVKLPYDPNKFVAQQVFYSSKDGTKVPMTLLMSKDVAAKPERRPTLLFGYGGFDISLTPRLYAHSIPWLERGGVFAIANLRGGGEYGKEWHDAGRLQNKQHVFDDFIAAAEYLIAQGWTSREQLAIEGRSNGGLLVGAVLTQRPDLFSAAVPTVGVLDMLRFHLFTVGAFWTTDYLLPDSEENLARILTYSPLHRVKAGTSYPATLLVTGDHDDRVVPAHSYKMAAALQAAQSAPKPILIRIATEVGHGAGAPLAKQLEERADVLAFVDEWTKISRQ